MGNAAVASTWSFLRNDTTSNTALNKSCKGGVDGSKKLLFARPR
jgi:hypothetical protein